MCANFSEFSKHLMPKQTYLLPAAVVAAATAIHTILWFQLSKFIKAHQVHRSEPAPNSPGARVKRELWQCVQRSPPYEKKEWKLAIRPVRDMDPPMLLLLGAVHVNNCCKKANRKEKQKLDFFKMFLHKFCGKRLESIFFVWCWAREHKYKYQTKLVN